MAVLLLQLVGPMQSWGYMSRWDNRDTGREPTKSGVIGLLAAACGIPRDGDISRLASLRMSVRIDSEGSLSRDYQTAGGGTINGSEYGVPKASGGIFGTVVSERFFLVDAAFLVALEGESEILREVEAALSMPCWPLALGRRSYPPSLPVKRKDGFYLNRTCQDLFGSIPCLKGKRKRLRVAWEIRPGETPMPHELRRSIPDQPISFAPPRHTLRDVAVGYVEIQDSQEKEI